MRTPGRRCSAIRAPAAAGRKRVPPPGRRRGFTLVEMLTVIAIATILMTMIAGGLIKAREMARRARAETELRELVAAWLQFYQFNENEWPSGVDTSGNPVPVTFDMLAPLIDPQQAVRGVVLLNVRRPEGEKYYRDPWGRPYLLSFKKVDVGGKGEIAAALRTSVSFPNRERRAAVDGN